MLTHFEHLNNERKHFRKLSHLKVYAEVYICLFVKKTVNIFAKMFTQKFTATNCYAGILAKRVLVFYDFTRLDMV